MEATALKRKFKENKWFRYGTVAFVVLIALILFFLIRSWLAPREPEIPVQWRQEIVGYWAFEREQGQKIVDTGRNSFSGQLGSSIKKDKHDPKWSGGKLGAALQFKGKDYALVPYHDKLDLEQQVTLEAWVKPGGESANESLWLPGWKYRRRIILNNQQRKFFKNAQIKLVLDTKSLIDQGKLQVDCEDLRFTAADKTTNLDWYIEEGCNSSTTEIWVKVPLIRSKSELPLYVYYGNFEVDSNSSFKATMEIPPRKSWRWPLDNHWVEEKFLAVAVNSKDRIMAGGYQYDRSVEQQQQWAVREIDSQGRRRWGQNYIYSSGTNQVNDIAYNSSDESYAVGFDTKHGNSQWRVKKLRGGWSYSVNPSSRSDRATALAIDPSDNLVVAGFDNSKGDAQWRVEKINPHGKRKWLYTKNISPRLDTINDVAIDSEGNILLAGVDKSKGNDQWRMIKLNSKGKWQYSYVINPSDGSDVITDVEIDPQGNILLAGYDFSKGNSRWRVIKLGPQGKELWSYKRNPSEGPDKVNSMVIDEYGNIIVAGFDYKQGDAQWRAEKLNPNGERVWAYVKNLSSYFDEIRGVVMDNRGNIILAGVHGANDSTFWVEKISERKYYNLTPKIKILDEEKFKEIPSLAIGKLGSYELRVNNNEVTAAINKNLISGTIGSEWNHLMLVFDGSQQKLYINSKLEASQTLTGSIDPNYNNLLIGFNFAGSVDEVKVYNQALTSEEVQQVYRSYKN